MSQDPHAKTQTLMLMESVKDLKVGHANFDERLRESEKSNAETKIYFKTIVSKLNEIQGSIVLTNDKVDEYDDRLKVIETKVSEAKGTMKGIMFAASAGGGIGAFLTKLFGGGPH